LRARSRFNGFCDDEKVLLICRTCQVSAQSVGSGDRPATLHGVVFDILRKPRRPGKAFAVTNWRATADEDGHYCFVVAL
jgi:hypothetical protein